MSKDTLKRKDMARQANVFAINAKPTPKTGATAMELAQQLAEASVAGNYDSFKKFREDNAASVPEQFKTITVETARANMEVPATTRELDWEGAVAAWRSARVAGFNDDGIRVRGGKIQKAATRDKFISISCATYNFCAFDFTEILTTLMMTAEVAVEFVQSFNFNDNTKVTETTWVSVINAENASMLKVPGVWASSLSMLSLKRITFRLLFQFKADVLRYNADLSLSKAWAEFTLVSEGGVAKTITGNSYLKKLNGFLYMTVPANANVLVKLSRKTMTDIIMMGKSNKNTEESTTSFFFRCINKLSFCFRMSALMKPFSKHLKNSYNSKATISNYCKGMRKVLTMFDNTLCVLYNANWQNPYNSDLHIGKVSDGTSKLVYTRPKLVGYKEEEKPAVAGSKQKFVNPEAIIDSKKKLYAYIIQKMSKQATKPKKKAPKATSSVNKKEGAVTKTQGPTKGKGKAKNAKDTQTLKSINKVISNAHSTALRVCGALIQGVTFTGTTDQAQAIQAYVGDIPALTLPKTSAKALKIPLMTSNAGATTAPMLSLQPKANETMITDE